MEVEGARKFVVSNRSLTLVIPLCALLLASGIWNVRQYQFAERQRLKAVAAAREARVETARAEVEAERAKVNKKAAMAKADTRVDQLYQEINNLTRMSEQVLLRNPRPPDTSAKQDGRDEAVGAP
ncbi:MAG: hypothetical protein ACHRXM_04780 [Isosphaerales bacterium]